MRIGRMSVFVLAVAVAGALALAGIALAGGDSTATFKFSPDKVPKRSRAKGRLTVHTHTDYTGVGTKTRRAQLYFDDDLKIRTKRIPRCNKASISGTITMQQAMAACGNAKVGSGRAQANLMSPGDVQGCVLAFNGKPSGGRATLLLFTRLQVPGAIDCSNPASNTNGNTPVLLEGLLKGASGDYGTQLDVDHIPQTLPLSDFRVSIKRGRYVSARCHDGNKKWNMKAKFTYLSPSATQKVNSSETCRVKQGRPNTKLTRAKVNQRRHKAKFKFKAKGTATGFQCKLKRKHHKAKGFRHCGSPKTYKHLKRGKYTFKVRAIGPAGKDKTPAKKRFKIHHR